MSTPVTMVQPMNDDDDTPGLALIEPLLASSESDDGPAAFIPSIDTNNTLVDAGTVP